jgi:hypothetical protein
MPEQVLTIHARASRILTWKVEDMENNKLNKHAKALSKMGAAKGGKARASVLTSEQRKEIAQKAVRTRWARAKGIPLEEIEQVPNQPVQSLVPSETMQANVTKKPISWFPGQLTFGDDITISCHLLSDGKRVFAQREVVGALTGNKKGGLDRYLTANNLSNYLNSEDITKKTVQFLIPGTNAEAMGFEATLLIEICDAYMRAREDKVLKGNQLPIAKRAEIIMRSCAKVGVIALIDEATGFQKVRAENALRLKLQAFIADEMQEWVRMFPEQFWLQLARLENVHYSPRSRPLRWGKYVMAFVYDAVDEEVGRKLREKNPNPHFKNNLHQWLKEYGREQVSAQLNQVLGIMKTCQDMSEFRQKFDYVFKKTPLQTDFLDLVDSMNQK